MPERATRQLIAVLTVLLTEMEREWYGLELMAVTQLPSGTIYPILHRLVADGWIERTHDAPSDAGGPTRRLYKLTGVGARAASELLDRQREHNASRNASGQLRPRLA